MLKTAFITGGTGFLGHHLVRKLRERDVAVKALVRDPQRAATLVDLGAELVVGDLAGCAPWQGAVPGGVDAFFHVAANTSMWRGHAAQISADNVAGTQSALEAAQTAGAQRLVFTSSAGVWGLGEADFDEQSPRRGAQLHNPYIDSKLAAESLVEEFAKRSLPAVIVYPGHLLGEGDTAGWARSFIDLQAGRLPLAPKGAGTWSCVEAVADAHIRAAAHPAPSPHYLLGGPVVSYAEVLQQIATFLAVPPPRGTAPGWLLAMNAGLGAMVARFSGTPPTVAPGLATLLNGRMAFSSARAERELGYRPSQLETMLQRTHRSLVSRGMLDA